VISSGRRRPCAREALHNLTELYPEDLDLRDVTRRGLRNRSSAFVPLLDQQQYRCVCV
jgi:hypothetical protein